MLYCDRCTNRGCLGASTEGLAAGCPSFSELQPEVRAAYTGDERMAAVASHVATRDGYPWASRVEETMLFAARSGFRKIGVAFCITVAEETHIFCDVLRDNGFEVASVLCKNGALPRELLGEPLVCNTAPGQNGALCNPIAQAKLLNAEGCDLNVAIGLCVGHDALFFKYSQAPATCLAVKDRACNHAPLEALRQHDDAFERIHHMQLPNAL